jgi:hypothetical protein
MFDSTRGGKLESNALGLGTLLILLASLILVGDLLSQTVIGPWLVRDHDIRYQQGFNDDFSQLKVLGPGIPYTYHRWSGPSGHQSILVDSHQAFAACGLREDDSFGARVVADRRGMPWRVEDLEGPSAHRACLTEVLATLPLEEELEGMWSAELVFRTDLPTLRTRWDRDHPSTPYLRWHLEERDRDDGGILTRSNTEQPPGDLLGEASSLLACPSEFPALVRLDLRYEHGELVRAQTTPAVPCAEELAREHADALLALLYVPDEQDRNPFQDPVQAQDTDWIEIAFELPLEMVL